MSKLSYTEWKKGMDEAPLFFYNVPHERDNMDWVFDVMRSTLQDMPVMTWNYTPTYDTTTGTTMLYTQQRT